jgi:hypothetical protein
MVRGESKLNFELAAAAKLVAACARDAIFRTLACSVSCSLCGSIIDGTAGKFVKDVRGESKMKRYLLVAVIGYETGIKRP